MCTGIIFKFEHRCQTAVCCPASGLNEQKGHAMNVPQNLLELLGDWTGSQGLWLDPEQPERRSEMQAQVALAGQGKFWLLRYRWNYEGQPQDGLLLVGFNQARRVVSGIWIDSWHMDDQMMLLQGEAAANGALHLSGSYSAPPGPDWGWWIEVAPQDSGFKLVMHNVTPEGQAFLAVEAALERTG
jgi:hypothetical protein